MSFVSQVSAQSSKSKRSKTKKFDEKGNEIPRSRSSSIRSNYGSEDDKVDIDSTN